MEELSLFTRILEVLRTQPVMTLLLILGVVYLIGSIRIGSIKSGLIVGYGS